jgi:hypothetical protein
MRSEINGNGLEGSKGPNKYSNIKYGGGGSRVMEFG